MSDNEGGKRGLSSARLALILLGVAVAVFLLTLWQFRPY